MDASELLELYAAGERDFCGADLEFTDLGGADLSGADLSNAGLSNADLSNADLSGADLSGADLSYTNLVDANLRYADLNGANLRYADLNGTAIDKTTKIDNKWRLVWEIVNQGASGKNLSNADLSETYLSYANLSGANLNGADLSDSYLEDTNLSNTNLSGADLSGTCLNGAKLIDANLAGTDLTNAILDKTKLGKIISIAESSNVTNQGIKAPYKWNRFYFRSKTEIKIAEALDRADVLFYPKCKARLTTPKGRESKATDFLIFHAGKWGILEVDGEPWHPPTRTVHDHERDRLFKGHGIHVVEHYDATRCCHQPDKVVQEFLEILSRV